MNEENLLWKIIGMLFLALAIFALAFWVSWMINFQLLGFFLAGLGVHVDEPGRWLSSLILTIWFTGFSLGHTISRRR